ncbi:histone deacetylase 15 isoform X1 [Populus alba]|uniref:histone deacetylase n=2 Tax=Populus alba x Populus x berolinensis TaxID=444605 RepID=A0AAD6M1V6_9ROSI|nr:histone deacetylase 15 isoform X1 [Populus alba]XP_034914811.1 histone deacetylase 15 isoform X1 [Populus alba]XP_034914812.1 histone deacetylase 15 isoform X1 [Populus alba]XP_034914814.1 histone deacetylase 15 isoform X1 [Populus alba]KAJ6977206.1 histone deacetylase 15 isoform X1 [Populus alba x Populus x berolinensis]
MGSETIKTGRLANGEAQKSVHKERRGLSSNGMNGKHENLGSNRAGTSSSGEGYDLMMNTGDVDGNLDGDIEPVFVCKKARQGDLTFQDIHDHGDFFDEDEEDDSDWEPVQKHVELIKWFCVNCTMVNLGDGVVCDLCGEHKDSGILRLGFFASPSSQDAGCSEVESEMKGKNKEMHSQLSASNSSTAIGFDQRMLLHSEVQMKSHPHPERSDRLRAIAASLATAGLFPGRCYPISAREITREELQMVHSLEHIQDVELTSHIFSSYFTPDTYANEHSACAARLAAGLCADLASTIFSGRVKNGFAMVRPPGHHAGVREAMGFCLHNNAAVAALAAQAAGAKKVLIVDWDVHHGNGTQEIFDQNKSVLYISLHRHEGGKFYPGTGSANEVGRNGAEGSCVNIPWSRGGVGDNDYIFAFQNLVLPIATEFAPDFTIISAGFDAARGDPLGCCDVTPAGYSRMTDMLYTLTGGKLLVILEGGYNLRSISSSATSVIKVLLGEGPGSELGNIAPSRAGLQTVLEVMKIQMNFWPSLGSSYAKLQSQWGAYCNTRKQIKKRQRTEPPIWWKWGRKRLLYHILVRRLHVKSKGKPSLHSS